MKKTIIFPHVPKTGGTTIHTQLKDSGLNLFLDYDAIPGLGKGLSENSQRRNKEFSNLDFSAFDIVFGHFPIERYQRDNYQYIAFVREPYARFVSQYNYLMSRDEPHGSGPPHVTAQTRKLRSGEFTLVTWARRFGMFETYKLYLSYWPAERFALIGETSRFAEFAEQFRKLTGVMLDVEVKERQNTRAPYPISPEDEAQIRKLLRNEYAWYNSLFKR